MSRWPAPCSFGPRRRHDGSASQYAPWTSGGPVASAPGTCGSAHVRSATHSTRLRRGSPRGSAEAREVRPVDPSADRARGEAPGVALMARPGKRAKKKQSAPSSTAATSNPVVTLTRASAIVPRNTEWAWKGRIPLGAVTLTVGPGGLGKSTLIYDRIAKLTQGALEGDLFGTPVTVLIAAAEDDPNAVVVPRLMAVGADLDRVYIVTLTHEEVVGDIELPRDIEQLGQRGAQKHAKFLFVDPLMAHISLRLDAHRDQHVRAVLGPLRRLGEEHGIAIVCTLHLNKRETADVLTRVGGSVGFGAAARSVLLLAKGKDAPVEDGTDEVEETEDTADDGRASWPTRSATWAPSPRRCNCGSMKRS